MYKSTVLFFFLKMLSDRYTDCLVDFGEKWMLIKNKGDFNMDEDKSIMWKYRNAIREMIKDENEIRNQRTNWFLVIQGFLIAGVCQLPDSHFLLKIFISLNPITSGNSRSFQCFHHFAFSKVSYNWDHTIWSLFRLDSFTK